MMPGGEFAVMTLFAEHQLQGVFYADNGEDGGAIGEDVYRRFKELVMRLSHRN